VPDGKIETSETQLKHVGIGLAYFEIDILMRRITHLAPIVCTVFSCCPGGAALVFEYKVQRSDGVHVGTHHVRVVDVRRVGAVHLKRRLVFQDLYFNEAVVLRIENVCAENQ
jgi:hypothetical protein